MECFILYDKVLNDKYFSKDEEPKVDSNENSGGTIAEEKTADELYKEYLNNLKENINKTYNDMSDSISEEEYQLNEEPYEYGSRTPACIYNDIENYESCAYLNNDNKLNIIFYEIEDSTDYVEKDKKYIDSNVLQIFIVEDGNAGMHYVYYIKENGKMYVSPIESLLDSNINPKEVSGLKNIVNVIPSDFGFISGWSKPIFVDIEGNLFRDDGKVIKLNQE